MTLLQDYIAKLHERVEDERSALARGAAASYEEYKHRTGIIQGINLAVELLAETYKSKPPEERN